MPKLLITLSPALKARLHAVSQARRTSMAGVVREALEAFTAEPTAETPPFTIPVDIAHIPSVDELHVFADAAAHYASARLKRDVSLGGVARDGFKLDVVDAGDFEVFAHHIFVGLVRTEYDFAFPLPLGLFRVMKVRAMRGIMHVEFEHVMYNASQARMPESEIGAGAALLLLAVPDGWRDGRECAALLLGNPQAVVVGYGEHGEAGVGPRIPYCTLGADFQVGALIRVRDGERLGEKLQKYKSRGLAPTRPVTEATA